MCASVRTCLPWLSESSKRLTETSRGLGVESADSTAFLLKWMTNANELARDASQEVRFGRGVLLANPWSGDLSENTRKKFVPSLSHFAVPHCLLLVDGQLASDRTEQRARGPDVPIGLGLHSIFPQRPRAFPQVARPSTGRRRHLFGDGEAISRVGTRPNEAQRCPPGVARRSRRKRARSLENLALRRVTSATWMAVCR